MTIASTSPIWSRTRQSSWLGTVSRSLSASVPSSLSLNTEPNDCFSSASYAVDPSAVQTRLRASEELYPVIVESLGARTCCPAWK